MHIPATRRALLHLSAAVPLLAQRPQSGPARTLAYVATYSSPQGPEGSRGRGQGIYLFEMNPASGALTRRDLFLNDANPSWLAFHPSLTHLYSANEISNYAGQPSGSAGSYSIDRTTGRLTPLNTESSHGAGPCYISVHPSGKHVFLANYHGGTIAALPVLDGGKLGPATDVKQVPGQPGPGRARSAPPGSFAISGHDRSHAHMILADPSGRFILSADLGLDRLLVWRFDTATGRLTLNPAGASLPPGDGPRHFAFHPNGRWLYSLQEEASTLALFDYDGAQGRLTQRQMISTLPKGFAGTNFTSEVAISPDARFVYAANRLHDSIAWFSIDGSGELALAGEEWTRGDYPRSFTIAPGGNYLYSCNQRADAIACFRVNRETGALTFTGQYTAVGTPAQILFLTL